MLNKEISNQLAILFLSCDKYQDLWQPLFYCVRKYFKQKKYVLYLGSNTLSYEDKQIRTLLSGPDKDWSTSLIYILDKITTPYIFIWLEDMFPIETVDMDRFNDTLTFMIHNKAKHIQLSPYVKPDYKTDDGIYGVYEKGAPYRTTVLGFWEVKYLKELLISGESPWNFEVMGSYRCSFSEGFYCCMKPLIKVLHVVEKSKIYRNAFRYCIKHSIPIDVDKRLVMSDFERIGSGIKKINYLFMRNISWRVRLVIMNFLRKVFVSY